MHLHIGNKVYSSWSMRPWIVMKAKDIAFDETLIRLRDTATRQTIIDVSPSGKVPCLVDGDVKVWETIAILEYLADKFPDKAIWPSDRGARAHARAIAAEMHTGFQNLRNQCPMVITQRFAARALPDAVQADCTRIAAIWNEALGTFADRARGPFLYGEFSAADGMYAPVVSRFHTYAIPLDPIAQAYADAVRAHTAYIAWVDDAIAEPWTLAQNETETLIEDLRATR